jgi:type IV secretory pathway protease TraF
MVIAWPPDVARDLASRRRYLPRNVPLVKPVAAIAGDRVCARAAAVSGALVSLFDPALRKS